MVDNVTSYSGNGLRDWLVQRGTAIFLTLYLIILGVFWLQHPHPSFQQWHQFYAQTWLKIISFLALLGILAHAWIGMWTVYTDYVKPALLRLVIQVVTMLTLVAYVAWGVSILWGN